MCFRDIKVTNILKEFDKAWKRKKENGESLWPIFKAHMRYFTFYLLDQAEKAEVPYFYPEVFNFNDSSKSDESEVPDPEYNNANGSTEEAENTDENYLELANSFFAKGDFEKANFYIDQVIAQNPTNLDRYLDKANIMYFAGEVAQAIEIMSAIIQSAPHHYYGYFRRGWFRKEIKDYQGALNDFTISINLNPQNAQSYLYRGEINKTIGSNTAAKNDFENAININTNTGYIAPTAFAYFHLGLMEKAMAWVNSALQTNYNANIYDAACFYSLIGDEKKAIDYLEQELMQSTTILNHMERDPDLDNIRNHPDYIALIQRYKEQNTMSEAEASPESPKAFQSQTNQEIQDNGMKFCPNCGKEIKADSAFCKYCGTRQ